MRLMFFDNVNLLWLIEFCVDKLCAQCLVCHRSADLVVHEFDSLDPI